MKYLQIFENQRKQWSGELEKDEWYFSSFRDNLITSLEVEDYNECIDDLIIILKSEKDDYLFSEQLETLYQLLRKLNTTKPPLNLLNNLKFFEESKKNAWIFDRTGKLEHSAFDEFTDEFRTKLDIIVENCNMFMGEPTLKNPISIKIAMNPEKSVILKDENIQ